LNPETPKAAWVSLGGLHIRHGMTGVGAALGAILRIPKPARDLRTSLVTKGMGENGTAVDVADQGRSLRKTVPHGGLLGGELFLVQAGRHGVSLVEMINTGLRRTGQVKSSPLLILFLELGAHRPSLWGKPPVFGCSFNHLDGI
jgi:hypothetical protein